MGDLSLLSGARMRRIEPCFPLSRGRVRVDDRRVLSGIVYVIRNGLMWRDAPPGYGPHKTLRNRFVRWSRMGGAAQGSGDAKHRWTAGGGGLNSTLHAVCDEHGRPRVMLLSEGQMSDCKSAALMLGARPDAPVLIADRCAHTFMSAITLAAIVLFRLPRCEP